jgi:hypothetical protein
MMHSAATELGAAWSTARLCAACCPTAAPLSTRPTVPLGHLSAGNPDSPFASLAGSASARHDSALFG